MSNSPLPWTYSTKFSEMEKQQGKEEHTKPQSEDATQECEKGAPKPRSLMDVIPFEDKGEPATKKSRDDFITCHDCNIVLPPGQDAQSHFSGKRHAKRVAANTATDPRDGWQDGKSINVNPQDHNTPSVASQFRTNLSGELPNNAHDNSSPYPISNTQEPPSQQTYPNARYDPRQGNFNDNLYRHNDTTDYRASYNDYRPSQNYTVNNQPYTGNSSSDDRYAQGYTTSDNRSSHQAGYPRSLDSGKGNALKSFYGQSLNSYLNPPEKDYIDDIPDDFSTYSKNDPFSRQDQNRNSRDSGGPQYGESNNYSRYGNTRYDESRGTGDSSGFFSSDSKRPKPKDSLALKSFYGSSLDTFFNPPENDYISQFPDEGDNDEEGNDYYEKLANTELSKVNIDTTFPTEEVNKEPDYSEEDFWRNPPDNLLASPGKDSDEADTVEDLATPQEPIQNEENANLPYPDDRENVDAIECTYDSNRSYDDYSDPRETGRQKHDDSGNYYSNRYYTPEHRDKNYDNYTSNDYNYYHSSDPQKQVHPNYNDGYNNPGYSNPRDYPSTYDADYHNGKGYSDTNDGSYNYNTTGHSNHNKNYEAGPENNADRHNLSSNDITQLKEQVVET